MIYFIQTAAYLKFTAKENQFRRIANIFKNRETFLLFLRLELDQEFLQWSEMNCMVQKINRRVIVIAYHAGK